MVLRRILLILVIALVVTTGYVALNFVGPRSVETHGTLIEPSQPASDFTLTSADGPVQLADLRGKVVVLFFGYTFCPDVCPLTMVRLGQALELLGEDAEDIQVVMVTVDPERDTPERLAEYVTAFHPSFIGLTGTPEEIGAVAATYGIYHAKAEGSEATHYLVDHSSSVTVLDRHGGVRLIWPFDVPAEAIAEDLELILHR